MGGVWCVQCLDRCRPAMKSTLKSDQHCELYDSVNHLKFIACCSCVFFYRMFSCDEGSSEV